MTTEANKEFEHARWLPPDRKWPYWLDQSIGTAPISDPQEDPHQRIDRLEEFVRQMKDGLIQGLGQKVIDRTNRDRRRIEYEFGSMEWSTPRGNLVKHGGFQDWNAGVTLPNDWTSTGAGGMTISRVAAPASGRTGTYAVQIATTGTEGGVTQELQFHPGQRHTLAIQCYLVSGTGAAIELVYNGTGGLTARKVFNVTGAGLGVGAWFGVPVEGRDVGRIKLPIDATTCTVKLLSQGTSTVRFANAQFGQGVARNYQMWEENAGDVVPVSTSSGLTYNPSATAVLNVSGLTPGQFNYIHSDAVVHGFGAVLVTPTAAGLATFRLSIPVASNFANTIQAHGTAVCSAAAGLSGDLASVAATDDLLVSMVFPDTTQRSVRIGYGYEVI